MNSTLIAALAGAAAATVLAVAIYLLRDRISALQSTARSGVSIARARLSRGAEETYRDAVASLANGLHVAGHLVPLEQIAVLPDFYAIPRSYDPMDEDENPELTAPHSLVPLVPEWPEVIAPFHLPGIGLEGLLRGDDGLVLLGKPGSGRTVALALIALLIARQREPTQEGGLLDEPRLPIYFHLGDLNLDPELYLEEADPLSPMMEAARPRLRGLAGRLLGTVQKVFAAGDGVILADGWDELAPDQQKRVTAWLKVLCDTYTGNKIIVSADVRGYHPLQAMGLTPVFLMPWNNDNYAQLATLWARAWPDIAGAGRDRTPEPAEETVRRAVRGNRARSPLDATLRIWSTFAGDDPGQGQMGWYEAYLNRVIPAPELRPALLRLVELMFDQNDATGISLEDATTAINAVIDAQDIHSSLSTPDYLYAIVAQTHLLTEHTGGWLRFTHPAVGAYLTALAFRDGEPRNSLLDDKTFHRLVLPFLAQMRNIQPYVDARLQEAETISRNLVLDMAGWLGDADSRAPWRAPIFKHFTALFLRPSEFPDVRERTMAALVVTHDPNVLFIFREGIKNPDPFIRRLSVLGLGALGDPEAVVALGEMIHDPDATVEIAAGLALGAIGTKTALNYMIEMLLSTSDPARRGVAELLAATNLAGEGHDVLREASHEADHLTRKAAVYGLDRIGSEWALERVAEMERLDDQWMVRAAAGIVLERRRAGKPTVPRPAHPPLPSETRWLMHWLADRNDSVAPGPQGITQLIRSLQEGDEVIRLAAVEALGALAAVDAVKPLYNTLRDQHPEIRDAAHRALATVSRVTGRALPAVMSDPAIA